MTGLLIAAATVLAGCPSGGSPSGFPKGDHWTFPLVGPMENGVLIVPGTVQGHGPYLFAIDPDASISAVDPQVAVDAKLNIIKGPTLLDEAGTEQMRRFAELVDLQLGTLTIDRRSVMILPGSYGIGGRQVNGLIGRDVIADTLVFGFDRDQGIAMLSTPQTFTPPPPPDAIAITYQTVDVDPVLMASVRGHSSAMESSNTDDASRIGVVTREGPTIDPTPTVRRVAAAQIGGVQVAMHLDLGGPISELREPLWAKVKAAPADVKQQLVDEVATVRDITRGAIASDAALGAAKATRITLVPYADKRFAPNKIDGALGLDFFRSYAVYANWTTRTYHLKPRGDAAATAVARIGRWGAALPSCPHPGCVTATLTATTGGTRLDIVRDPEAAKRALEIFLGVTPAAGKSAPALVVELPANVDKISGGVPETYDGATLTVLDASPFTRPCDGNEGCVYPFDTPGAH